MIIDIFALLCGMAVTAFAATANDISALVKWLAGFILGAATINPVVLGLPWQPLLGFDATQFAMLILLVACSVMNNYRKATIPLFMSGVLAVIWISALGLQGLPRPAALVLVLAVSLYCLQASLTRHGFSGRQLEDEANIMVLLFALVLIIVPGTLSGWESAVILQDRDDTLSVYRERLPAVLSISVLFGIMGAFYARRKYR